MKSFRINNLVWGKAVVNITVIILIVTLRQPPFCETPHNGMKFIANDYKQQYTSPSCILIFQESIIYGMPIIQSIYSVYYILYTYAVLPLYVQILARRTAHAIRQNHAMTSLFIHTYIHDESKAMCTKSTTVIVALERFV